MKKIRIGVLCPSEIAFRRFMPALQTLKQFEYVGIASASATEWSGITTDDLVNTEKSKAEKFHTMYGGIVFDDYSKLLNSENIDAVYIPLPPALHYKWAKTALELGKHVLLEKPFTTSIDDTTELITTAKRNKLAVHENYMFVYHTQLEWIFNKIQEGAIGDIRLIRVDFGFPFRGKNDFRYNKELGGGALLDCGGYTVKLASLFLGHTAKITTSNLCSKDQFDVDIYGNATLTNADGLTAQISFGMDNSYRCNLEVWGSNGSIFTNRILTAPDNFNPTIVLKQGNEEQEITLGADDTFKKSIDFFGKCISNSETRTKHYDEIIYQGNLIEQILCQGIK